MWPSEEPPHQQNLALSGGAVWRRDGGAPLRARFCVLSHRGERGSDGNWCDDTGWLGARRGVDHQADKIVGLDQGRWRALAAMGELRHDSARVIRLGP
jgi:hypothetical protein